MSSSPRYEDRFEYSLYTTRKAGPDAFLYLWLALAAAFAVGVAVVALGAL